MLAGARTPLLIVANRVRPLRRPVPPPSRLPRPHSTLLDSRRPACAQNFLTACVVMFLIFLPNIIWGRSAPIHNARRKQYARDARAEKQGKQVGVARPPSPAPLHAALTPLRWRRPAGLKRCDAVLATPLVH